MEIYRRLGVADKIRAQGLPDDFPNDVVYATTFTGFELTRFRMPCRRDRFNDDGYDDGNLPSPERAARVSQMYLAPVLLEHVQSYPNVTILNGVKFVRQEQHAESVTVQAQSRAGEPRTINCKYLIGADGARSEVRRALGIELQGEDNLLRARSRLFRAPGLLEKCGYPTAWMHWFFVRGQWSSMIAIDGKDLWLMHNFIPPSVKLEDFDVDAGMREALGLSDDFT
jgi:2-polyprenyl-6-methoxyphenol hydroxylase-like FAD-dependent oxidoreductase